MTKELEGKSALVTGGRRGIGKAVALAMAVAGADVAVADVVADDGLLTKTAREIKSAGRRSLAIKADISVKEEVEKMIGRVVGEFGGIDILVNCAGIWIPGHSLLDTTESEWDRVIDVNLKGTYLCCQAVGVKMREQRGGCMINLSSQVGLNPGTLTGAYSVSKAGIIMMTSQLAQELGMFHIRVNALAPGIVKTDFNREIWANPDAEGRIADSVPLGRLAEPVDMAGAVVFLASEAASYITGAVIPIDGGWKVSTSRRL
jgi:NAD(P)-dependent dehydrogenase (short-subunit alcohol dehydrogenase family)